MTTSKLFVNICSIHSGMNENVCNSVLSSTFLADFICIPVHNGDISSLKIANLPSRQCVLVYFSP